MAYITEYFLGTGDARRARDRETAKRAEAFREKVFTAQSALREDIDALEQLTPKCLWPVPAYVDMLFDL